MFTLCFCLYVLKPLDRWIGHSYKAKNSISHQVPFPYKAERFGQMLTGVCRLCTYQIVISYLILYLASKLAVGFK